MKGDFMKTYGDIYYVGIYHKDEEITIYDWAVQGIGFGQLVVDNKTGEILDDEYMGEGFCNYILEYVREKGVDGSVRD